MGSRSIPLSSPLSSSRRLSGDPGSPDRLEATLALSSSVTSIKGVSSARAQALAKLGIRTVRDLLTHFPRRYLDLSRVCTISQAPIASVCTIACVIDRVTPKRTRTRLSIVELDVRDATGVMTVTFFHMPWLAKRFKPGMKLAISGKVADGYDFKQMTNPYFEELEDGGISGKVLAIHPASGKLTVGVIRKIVEAALDETRAMFDPLPASIRDERNLISRGAALERIHRPRTMDDIPQAKERLIYEEVLCLQLYLMQQGSREPKDGAVWRHATDGPHVRGLHQCLPFELTQDQSRTIQELFAAMSAKRVADHMVLGDVGTGKTIVATFGMAVAADSGGQSLLMAPTEILAQQHAKTLGPLFDQAGISWGLLTGSTPAPERRHLLVSFAEGELDALIGTHALIEDDVVARSLSFVVIDEQQRFGVDQRAKLLDKGDAPDALYMTATPIPRSLALTLFGNLTCSYLRQKPRRGSRRETFALERSQRGVAYDAAREALERGERVYVVCPLVGKGEEKRPKRQAGDEDEAYHPDILIEDDGDFDAHNGTSAIAEARRLASTVFAAYEVGLLHGGMTSDEKRQAMDAFVSGEVQVLVTTTVIEVGVDVPEATVMIVEDADRFGLSQLHQLRGRVGRADLDAQVYLVSSSAQPAALTRLAALVQSDDGFQIAGYDLSLRREGDILGNKQSGASALKLVNVIKDAALIEAAHEDARAILEADPDLVGEDVAALAHEVRMMFAEEGMVSGG